MSVKAHHQPRRLLAHQVYDGKCGRYRAVLGSMHFFVDCIGRHQDISRDHPRSIRDGVTFTHQSQILHQFEYRGVLDNDLVYVDCRQVETRSGE